MAATFPIISLAEYLKFRAPEGTKDELIEGEIVISPSGSPRHALLIKRLVRLLDDLLADSPFEVNADLSILVHGSSAPSMPRPDVFVMGRERFLDAARRDVFPEGAPELAIEIVSPGNTKKELLRKIKLYLRHGSSAVWVVYPKTRTIAIWESEDRGTEFREADLITLPDPLPRYEMPVASVFSVLP